ncbi:hypothetical protein FRC11_010060 [Ceratobasidium sp. 423]|nr:hypothetical protein FRC11_010060 [Ceratobasidium sp. 423]
MLFAYINGLREGGGATTEVVRQIEADLKNVRILPVDSNDPALRVRKMIVQECWRSAVFIYLYMALCRVPASDPRVENAAQAFMRLVNGVKPGRNSDVFLVIPMIIVGVATTKVAHRRTITSRMLATPECTQPNTVGNDSLRMLEDVWARTSSEGRAAKWEDMREACRRVTGV